MQNSDLRRGIYEHLVANVPSVTAVYIGWIPPANAVKPFMFFVFAGELPSLNTPLGLFIQVDMYVVGEEGSFAELDDIADEVINAIHDQNITTPAGRVIRCHYKRDARMDDYSQDLRGNYIRLKFWLPTDFWV